jgi:DNA-directed RNA polymerase alpha subunit
MNAQEPAEGILKRNDWGDSKWYQVVCSCGQEYHDHNVEVEATDHEVNVNIHTTAKTDYWSELVEKRYDIDNPWAQEVDWFVKDLINGLWTRLKVTWEIWTTGAVTVQTTISMTEQQTLNYAEILKSATKDCREFHNQRMEKK